MFSSNTSQVSSDALFVEDVFSTWLYQGNGSTQTINNGIDLAGKGGLVWAKKRTSATDENHVLFDTARGQPWLSSNTTNAQLGSSGLINYNADGFGWLFGSASWNSSGVPYASWTFRKQPKFFDVVTYTGDGTSNRQIPHNLGSVPGAMIVKTVSTTGYWWVYHRSLANTEYLELNGAYAKATSANMWASTTPTSTYFTVSAGTNLNNTSGTTYVAYLFAHNAGGFGLTGTENVISCGSYTGNGSATGPVVTLGYEPQWLLIKNASDISNWTLVDNMRGMSVQSLASTSLLYANLSNAEAVDRAAIPLATGFQINDNGSAVNTSGATYIYIAIRRGPMKVPTDGTKVFAPVARAGTGSATTMTAGFPVDLAMIQGRSGGVTPTYDRLRGANIYLRTQYTDAEVTSITDTLTSFASQTGVALGADTSVNIVNSSGVNYANWMFRRAPGFFDVVCYTGNGTSGTTQSHNLGVGPELMIVKSRSASGFDWVVYAQSQGNTKAAYLNSTQAFFTFAGAWNNTSPTSSTFTLGNTDRTNYNGATFVAYLFASCPGVSKVGSYTGTGTTQQINCGFTAGARFVLIKRTDSTGDWYVWDSARGVVAGNDPYLLLNSTAAEVTSTDYVDSYSAGFEISSTAPAAINASGGSFIYLAIA